MTDRAKVRKQPQGAATMADVRIRPYRAEDRAAIRRIATLTACRNMGGDQFIIDDDLFADYWTTYYTDYQSDHVWVVEQDRTLAGYCLGCPDTQRFIRTMGSRIVPLVLAKALVRIAAGRYRRSPATMRFIRWFGLHSWREMPSVSLQRFPAHYHCNLLPEVYHQQFYSAMALRFVDQVEVLNLPGVHGQVLEHQRRGPFKRMVDACQRHNPHLSFCFDEKPTDLFRAVLGSQAPMVNRAWGTDVATYREFLLFLQRVYRI